MTLPEPTTYCPECRHNLMVIDYCKLDGALVETLFFCPECGFEEIVSAATTAAVVQVVSDKPAPNGGAS